MSIKIIRPGIFSTIQDLGRMGYRSIGIGPGGAMDLFAASVANLLAGNEETYPVIEMHFPAAEILFEQDAVISIAGGNFNAYIDEDPLPLWQPAFVKRHQQLSFKKLAGGARTYLAIHGGLNADRWLNSFSTHTKIKCGGYKGRPLIKGDTISLPVSNPVKWVDKFPDLTCFINAVYEPSHMIRCATGPEWELVDKPSQNTFLQTRFFISAQSDRMGYRLKGTRLVLPDAIQLVSSPVDRGTLQLLPDGQLIVLMADHQTTGGYPRIAHVIEADMPKLAQCAIHRELQFTLTDIENAEESLYSLYQALDSIKAICDNYYHADRPQL